MYALWHWIVSKKILYQVPKSRYGSTYGLSQQRHLCKSHEKRPDNVLANFENISRETKRESFKGDEDRLQADDVQSPAIEIALKQKNLFAKGDDDEVEADVSTFV